MASIEAGRHTVKEILEAAGFDLEEKAKVDYNEDGVDRRRVKIGGLGFDDLDDVINVPVTANELEITLDGKKDTVLEVELNEEQQEERKRSFESAADTDDSNGG